MKKLLFGLLTVSCCAFLAPNSSNAQALGHDYKTGLGVKGGYWVDGGGALTVKHFIKPAVALEGLLSFGPRWMSITGLYEFHGNVGNAAGLKWYAGPGVHLGFDNNNRRSEDVYFGVDGVLGLDYKFNKVPISISVDVQPYLDFPKPYFSVGGGAGVRFTF